MKLAMTLELQTVAEGVEDAAQVRELAEMHCALGQGFLFAEPVPAAEIDAILAGARPGGVPRSVSRAGLPS